ncbi:MAG: hypothetical protein [Bacteriophage sp.]|nr:MAG: hypothetical protein [Bacteriophage sp.]
MSYVELFEHEDSAIEIEDGIVIISVRSYHIDSIGSYALTKEECHKLYQELRKHYGKED